jgi:hypothetical protein
VKKGKDTDEDVSIPELDELISEGGFRPWQPWTEREDKILKKYYNKVRIENIAEHLPGRTVHSCRARAKQIGASRKLRPVN